MKRIFFSFVRSASKIPFMPSPGNPNIVSTPHSIRRSTSKSAVVLAIVVLPFLSLFLEYECDGSESRSAREGREAFMRGEPRRRCLLVGLIVEHAVRAEVSRYRLEQIVGAVLRDFVLRLLGIQARSPQLIVNQGRRYFVGFDGEYGRS